MGQEEKIYRKKLAILREIFGIAQSQTGMLQEDDTEGFSQALDKRQQLMDEWEALTVAGSGDTPEARQYAQAAREIFRQIEALDLANRETAEKKLTEYRDQVRKTRQNQQGLNAYGKSRPSAEGFYIDTKK